MNQELPSFQRYQQAFTARIRDPINHPRPHGVAEERMAVYEEIVFNNLFESASTCFPIAQQVLGKRIWTRLVQVFLRDYSASTPLFRKIPEEFLSFLNHTHDPIKQRLPPYFVSLCHYEWAELFVATAPADEIATDSNCATDDLFAHPPILTQAMLLLNYDYAVHKISRRHKPQESQSTQLLIYRNHSDQVKFIELNLVTYKLIELLLYNPKITGKQALTAIANELKHPEPEIVLTFGKGILEELKSQGVILGASK